MICPGLFICNLSRVALFVSFYADPDGACTWTVIPFVLTAGLMLLLYRRLLKSVITYRIYRDSEFPSAVVSGELLLCNPY